MDDLKALLDSPRTPEAQLVPRLWHPQRCASCDLVFDASERKQGISFDLKALLFFCTGCAQVLRRRLARWDLGIEY